MRNCILVIGILWSSTGFTQQWQKSQPRGVYDKQSNCTSWYFESYQEDDPSKERIYVGFFDTGAKFKICGENGYNRLSGGPFVLANLTEEKMLMKMQFAETDLRGNCVTDKIYDPGFERMNPMINRKVPKIDIRQRGSDPIGDRFCFRVIYNLR